jgi:signal transduction histidine kinase
VEEALYSLNIRDVYPDDNAQDAMRKLNHLFLNIILNAAQAMEGRGHLTLKTCLESGKDLVGIEISDSGPGISNDVIPYIFEPFYTTKEEGQGTGLGLSLAYGIVENHGGHITVGNKPDGGAVFCITLPVVTGNSEGEQGAED